jgi:hypothetical protein
MSKTTSVYIYMCKLSLNCKTYVVNKILCCVKRFKELKLVSENAKVSADIVKLLYIPIYVDCLLTILLTKHVLQFNDNVHTHTHTHTYIYIYIY